MDQAFWESDGKQKVMENVVIWGLGPQSGTLEEHHFSPSFSPKSEVRPPNSYHSDTWTKTWIRAESKFLDGNFTEKPWNHFPK